MPKLLEFDYDVFISYSSDDKQWVRGELLAHIEASGLHAFIDFRDFTRGMPSIKECERGVMKCRKILVVLTPDYIKSEWCEIENIMSVTLSPANRDLRLIPLLKTQCDKPLRIAALTHIDFTEEADLGLAWRQLLGALDVQPDGFTTKDIPQEIQAELDRAKAFTDADNYPDAIPILEKTLIAADSSGHAVARVKTRLGLGHALYEAREDFLGAEQQFRDALVLVPIENLDLKISVLHWLGNMLLFSGRLDEAKAVIHEALDVAKLSGKKNDLAGSLISLSLLEHNLGFHDNAILKLDNAVDLLLQQALSLTDDEKKHHAHMLAVCYINKAGLYRDAGNLDEALAFYRKAEEQHHTSGEKLNAGKALLFCGEVHCANADWEKGLDCFGRALKSFKEATNPIWGARALEHISRLYATHEKWEEALETMFGAVAGAKESGHSGEQVHFLCLAAELLRNWKTKIGRDNVARKIHALAKNIPEDQQGEVMSSLSAKLGETNDAIEKAVREDKEVRDLLNQAKEIAQREHLHEHLANCLLDEAYKVTPPDEKDARHNLIAQAIELLKNQLQNTQSPKRRGRLMNRISGLYWELGEHPEALSWLKKAGEVFKKSGDAFGLANFHASLAEIHRAEGRLDDEISAYRTVLSIIESRSFYDLAAGTRVNLAAALRYRREFGEAQKLLNEAEVLCNRHHFKDFISAIARNRTVIEKELQTAQVPAKTLPQLIDSLNQLITYHPEYAVAYLAFWYFAWQTELVALVRSGPHLSFMVVTDDVARFMKFAEKFRYLADHYLMTTSCKPTVKVEDGVLPIPPSWMFPASFTFIFAKRDTPESGLTEQEMQHEDEDVPPRVHLEGPATMLPSYIMINAKSEVNGEGHMMALSAPYLPQEAIDLMIGQPIEKLIQLRTVWFPIPRFKSKDPFLTDLRVGYERGLFPVYFDHLPTSDAVAVCGGTQVTISRELLIGNCSSKAVKWHRALLKLTNLSKDEARATLHDLSDVFGDIDDQNGNSIKIEVYLFEFVEIDRRIVYPALLIRE